MKTFIRAVEYWALNADGSLLEFAGGLFGEANRFAAISNNLCFGRGEGLPGQVWESGRPIVLSAFEGSYFRRAAAAKAVGLTCAIAVPIFKETQLTSVVVLFCGDDEVHVGAIELWGNDPSTSQDLSLVDGYYGSTGDNFEVVSRSSIFPIGTGLPGMAWDTQKPVFMPEFGKSSGFLRAEAAGKVGINRGFAIPCSSADGSNYVMAFLSAISTPLARRVEIWEKDESGDLLLRKLNFSEDQDTSGSAEGISLTGQSSHPLVQAFRSGVPAVAEPMVAIPVAPQGRTTAVMALYF